MVKMRMCYGLALATLVLTSLAQDIRPLPSPDKNLVDQFSLALDAVFGMGIRLQAVLQEEKTDNFLVSPLSAAVIIGQLVLGAEGEFRKELVDLLSLPKIHQFENNKISHYGERNRTQSLPYSILHIQLSHLLKSLERPLANKQFILSQKSAVFANKYIQLKNEFKRNLNIFYEAQVLALDFNSNPIEAQSQINAWANKNTNGLIKTILQSPPSRDTAAIFSNAIYFKADWEIPFSDVLNRNASFKITENKEVKTTYMIGMLEEILYSESEEYRVIALPYKNEELGMYIMLPNADSKFKYDMKGFIKAIRSNVVLEVIKNARRRDVIVKIPKLKITNTFSILNELKKYKVYKTEVPDKVNTTAGHVADVLKDTVGAFNNFTSNTQTDIYLTNAANQNLRIDDIVQQVFITVNEKGTEAAAISASTIDYIGGQKTFLVDRPFVFFIRHEATSATLFWGSVSNPSA